MVHLIVLLFSSNFSHGLEETIIPFSAPGFSGLVSSEGTRGPIVTKPCNHGHLEVEQPTFLGDENDVSITIFTTYPSQVLGPDPPNS